MASPFDNLYGPPPVPILPTTPLPQVPIAQPQPQPQTQLDPFHALFASLLTPRAPTALGAGQNLGALLATLKSTPHLDMNGMPITTTSPFENGFFKSAADRFAVEQARGPVGNYGAVREIGVRPSVATTLPAIDPDVIQARYGPGYVPPPSYVSPTPTPAQHALALQRAKAGWAQQHPTVPWGNLIK